MEELPQNTPVLTGHTVGRFTVGERIGGGALGEVYRAEDTQLKRTVAIKRLKPTSQRKGVNNDLLREAQRASALNHTRVTSVYDVIAEGNELFLVMEYVDGGTLLERLKTPLSLNEFFDISVQCLEGVAAAHEKGILHGDLKPANIMLTGKGEVKVCDFGLARRIAMNAAADAQGTVLAGFAGTPAYIAPEIVLEQPSDFRADIFSLGVVLYEMLAGCNPFCADSMIETVDRIRTVSPESIVRLNPDVPPAVGQLVHRMIEKNPADRYSQTTEVLGDLRKIRANEQKGASPRRAVSRRTLVLAGILLAIVVAVTQISTPKAPVESSPSFPPDINLAILPFTVIGGDRDRQVFTDGLTETLNAQLSKLTVDRRLQVATSTVTRSRNVTDANEARLQLGANVVLAASLQYAGNEVRMSCSLIDTKSGRLLRTETMTAAIADSFDVQDRIVGWVIRMIGIELNPDQRRQLAGYGTKEPGAYEFYVQGRGYLLNFDRIENLDNAVTVFRRALDVDPRYGLAYSGLGEAYWQKYKLTKAVEWVELARGNCEGALALAPDLAQPHACLGMVLNTQGENDEAVNQFNLALEREPTNDAFYVGLATAYESLGRQNDAERTYRRAVDLRPQYWAAHNALGSYLGRTGRWDEAIETYKRVVALAPDSFRGYWSLGAVQYMKDQIPEATASFEKSLSIRPTYEAASNLATLYYFESRYDRAVEMFRQALSLNKGDYQVWGNLGAALRQLNNPEESASAYKRALELAEERLQVNPRDPDVQMAVADYAAAVGDAKKAMILVSKVIESKTKGFNTLFRLALFFEVRQGQRDEALKWLAKAVEAGQTWREIERSTQLRELRNDPRFQQMRNHSTNH